MNSDTAPITVKIGWIGAGRLGSAMVHRLLAAGHSVTVWNRTVARADALREVGARVAAEPADLARCDLVFTSLAASADLEEVVVGRVLAAEEVPPVIVDTSTVSPDSSRRVREAADAKAVKFLSAPISGNPSAVEQGLATFVCSGSRDAYNLALPALLSIGRNAVYVGNEEEARLVKICHNLLLAILTQGLAEVLVLAERMGVPRGLFMNFINDSVLGSVYTRYKTPAIRSLDLAPTFTSALLRKDLDLGMVEASDLNVPLPVTSLVRELVQAAVAQGFGDQDFLALLNVQARASGVDLAPEDTSAI